ncbi:MAG: molybdenum cofactor guanylyltransferase [Calditrichaeota bacterium]|nr:MAG: molybdenum cofactor guanylyltransferase [Calditrichota bacterium]
MGKTFQKTRVSAAILAGGKSNRMGQNKALMNMNGKPLIQHVHDVLQELSDDLFIVSNEPEKYRFLKRPLYTDEMPSIGPLAGIYTALVHSSNPNCIVLGCDMPFISITLLQRLLQKIEVDKITAVRSQERIEPLCAIYPQTAMPVIKALVANKRYKAGQLFREIPTAEIELEKSEENALTLFNINTPEEFAAVQNYFGHS